jgi:hypothetical protein
VPLCSVLTSRVLLALQPLLKPSTVIAVVRRCDLQRTYFDDRVADFVRRELQGNAGGGKHANKQSASVKKATKQRRGGCMGCCSGRVEK